MGFPDHVLRARWALWLAGSILVAAVIAATAPRTPLLLWVAWFVAVVAGGVDAWRRQPRGCRLAIGACLTGVAVTAADLAAAAAWPDVVHLRILLTVGVVVFLAAAAAGYRPDAKPSVRRLHPFAAVVLGASSGMLVQLPVNPDPTMSVLPYLSGAYQLPLALGAVAALSYTLLFWPCLTSRRPVEGLGGAGGLLLLLSFCMAAAVGPATQTRVWAIGVVLTHGLLLASVSHPSVAGLENWTAAGPGGDGFIGRWSMPIMAAVAAVGTRLPAAADSAFDDPAVVGVVLAVTALLLGRIGRLQRDALVAELAIEIAHELASEPLDGTANQRTNGPAPDRAAGALGTPRNTAELFTWQGLPLVVAAYAPDTPTTDDRSGRADDGALSTAGLGSSGLGSSGVGSSGVGGAPLPIGPVVAELEASLGRHAVVEQRLDTIVVRGRVSDRDAAHDVGRHVATTFASARRSGAAVGVALVPAGGMRGGDRERLRAALAAAARSARHGTAYVLHDASLEPVTTGLAAAIATDALDVGYRPLLRAQDGAVAGFEAALRWDDGRGGVMEHLELTDLARRTGQMLPLTLWAARRLVADAATLCARTHTEVPLLSLNLCADLLERPDVAGPLAEVLASGGAHRHRFVVELTETEPIGSWDELSRSLAELRRRGVLVALDDFGRGFANLVHLARLDVDLLKIDGSLVRSWAEGAPRGLELLRHAVHLGRTLDVAVVVQGIDDGSDLAALAALGATYAQGDGLAATLAAPAPPPTSLYAAR